MRYFYALLALTLLSTSAIAANPQVVVDTNRGAFVLELYPEKAPKTVANFMQYLNSGFYNGTVFHRVINRFMIQGGGFTPNMAEKDTLPPVANEAGNGLKNDIGTIAMARTSDPDSATSQFFINLENNQFLNYQGDDPQLIGYCVFGRVLKGMDVVREIAATPTGNVGPNSDVPKAPIIINSITVNKAPL